MFVSKYIYLALVCIFLILSDASKKMIELLAIGWVLLMVPGAIARKTEIVLNEDTILGTCVNTCEEIPELFNKQNCDILSQCRLNSVGWNRGFVRCDYCSCVCTSNDDDKDTYQQTSHVSITEPDLYGTCTGTCDERRGVIRTNTRGCDQVRDCWKASNGWTRGFVRCDYCTCMCDKTFFAASYKLTEVEYDFSSLSTKDNEITGIAVTTLENDGDDTQTTSRRITVSRSSTTTVTNSHSMEAGLTVTVGGSIGIPGAIELSSSVAASITTGFTYEASTSDTVTSTDQVTAQIDVPGHSSIQATITGHQIDTDIPYTATLETSYAGTTMTQYTPVSGIYTNIHISTYDVSYGAAKPLP